mgnify:CR=1 FL=1
MGMKCISSTKQQTQVDRVFIIRHAESKYNEAVKGNVLKKLSAKHDKNLLDAPLSEEGFKQC